MMLNNLNMCPYSVILLLFCHFVGDFIFQTSHMALNKGKNNKVLIRHAIAYIFAFIPIFLLLVYSKTLMIALNFILLNCVLHIIQDFWTSRLNAHLKRNYGEGAFFKGIGFDQFLHFVCLITTFYYLLNL